MTISITDKEQKIIEGILDEYKGYTFYYYGSRTKGLSEKTSDLDVLIKGDKEMPLSVLQNLKEKFDESKLPYIVNFLDYHKINEYFYKNIERDLIPYNWQEVKLGDICNINSCSYSANEHWEFINYLDTGNITENKIDNIQYIDLSTDKLPSRAKRKVCNNDIIYSTVRPNQLHYGIIKQQPDNFLVSTGFAVLNINRKIADPYYIYYNLTQNHNTEALQAIAEQSVSAYPSIKPTDIGNREILLPPLDVQKKIAGVLSALDDKIELNNKINNNLEQQTQALFKSWFIDFEPFGGKMPDDWKLGKLDEIIEISSGKRPVTKNDCETNEYPYPIVGASCIMGFTNQILYNERILIIGRVGTHGIVQRFSTQCWASDNTLVIKSPYYEYMYQILNLIDYSAINRGSTQPLITQTDLKNIDVIIPKNEILIKYEQIAGHVMRLYEHNQQENTRLSQLRDALLPKLMSGEIDVSNVDISPSISLPHHCEE